MTTPKTLLDVINLYFEYLENNYTEKQAKTRNIELWGAFSNGVLVGLNKFNLSTKTKQTVAQRQAITTFLETQPIIILLDARLLFNQGLTVINHSQKTKTNYQRSLESFLKWSNEQSWWPGISKTDYQPDSPDFCCSLIHKGNKRANQKLTHRNGRYLSYRLRPNEISTALQSELTAFYHYLTSPDHPNRQTLPVKPSCAEKNYIKDLLLFLGWFYRFENVPIENLNFNLLIPKFPKSEWFYLTSTEQDKFWRSHKANLKNWLNKYFQFLTEYMKGRSPRSKRSKLAALSALGKFQYSTEIRSNYDYRDIPILQVINDALNKNAHDVSNYNKTRIYVADQSMKWPNVVPGETALKTIQATLLEPLRIDCRPKYQRNKLRIGSAIALTEQKFIAWFLLAGIPPRRQGELRSLKLALSCPIERPDSVPLDGVYHPLPPNVFREQQYDGTLADNYIYKTYIHEGKHYKDGVWVLDIHDSKEWSTYGAQSIKIPNYQFVDNYCLYDYIQHYLYGWWLPGGRKNQAIYDWWEQHWQGRRGRWVGLGRSSFNPCDACSIYPSTLQLSQEHGRWVWGYFFVRPLCGLPFDGASFEQMIETTAHHYIGKLISPHTMRSIWATWAYQVKVMRNGQLEVGLSHQEKLSLAYAMGHDLTTMEKIYEQCTPEEKRRPIDEVVDAMFSQHWLTTDIPGTETSKRDLKINPNADLENQLSQLTESQRSQLAKILNIKQLRMGNKF